MRDVCVLDSGIKVGYITDETSFDIRCIVNKEKLKGDSKLYADFENDTSFEIGIFRKEGDNLIIDAKYSRSYLITQNIDINKLSGFSVHTADGEVIRGNIGIYDDFANDRSVIRAKELLNEIKSYSCAMNFINDINSRIDSFKNVNIPILTDFKWYVIDKDNEYFGLSSVSFFVNTLNSSPKPWFFGRCTDNRLYSVLIKTDKNISLGDIKDCVTKYRDNTAGSVYYAVGIMLLDDGQYFCRLA